jgi:tetraprenyl-beta-curcumene synthase
MSTHVFIRQARALLTFLTVLARYYLWVALPVRRCLRELRVRARAIPDPVLREIATRKLEHEHLNAEAAAVYATLAPARTRPMLARLLVTFEVMYDYLDAVSELPCADPVRSGLQLHRALAAAVDSPSNAEDYYRWAPRAGDGGYLAALARDCRSWWGRLPAADQVAPVLRSACLRCGEGQTRTHSVAHAGVEQLAAWGGSLRRESAAGYTWWELAAGAASSLAIHGLLAGAATPGTTAADAVRIDRAYFPSTCAMSTLLDSLIDLEEDALVGEHNYVEYYASLDEAADRLAWIARDGQVASASLPAARTHAVIAAGVIGFYMSAASGRVVGAGARVTAAMDPMLMTPLLAAVRLRRAIKARVGLREGKR